MDYTDFPFAQFELLEHLTNLNPNQKATHLSMHGVALGETDRVEAMRAQIVPRMQRVVMCDDTMEVHVAVYQERVDVTELAEIEGDSLDMEAIDPTVVQEGNLLLKLAGWLWN